MRLISFGAAVLAFAVSSQALAQDKLVIISPHRKSIQDEYLPKFKEYYKAKFGTDVVVDWLDQGGTSDDVRFIRAKFAVNPKTSGIDLFWGGGYAIYLDVDQDKMFEPYKLPAALKAQIPQTAAGVPLYPKDETFYGTALSSFGIFYNKKALAMEKIPEPKTWEDLGGFGYYDQITLTDPRRSGTASTMSEIVIQSLGWEKGWDLLGRIAANTRNFTHSSSDPIKAVVAADASASMAIDFYALAKIGDLGAANLGFALPEGLTIFDPDPVAILKGAPNRKVAERFVEWVLSVPAQKLLILPKGVEGGPVKESMGRMAVNVKAYEETEGKRTSAFNPFKAKSSFKLDIVKAAKQARVLNDLIGAIHVDTHKELKAAWQSLNKRKADKAAMAALTNPDLTEKQVDELAAKWDDEVFRNKKINEWVDAARAKYKKIADAKS